MDKSLKGKVAVVTGASSGFGEETALVLSEHGADIVAAARRMDRLADLEKRIQAKGAQVLTLKCDVQQEADCKNLIEQTMKRFGRIDILINNAGVMLLGPIEGADTDDWRLMINTNVLGLMYCTHAAVPHMRKQKSGHIVNISSVAGRTARAGSGVYNASKWAVGAFSEALRQEVHMDGIRTTIIEPGAAATELRDHITNKEVRDSVNKWAESMRQLESEDIAAAILYAVTAPDRVNVNEILIRPTDQPG